ncbi:hypothetical protein VCHA53O466_40180 [Vibrio chagasii]|nr:hypothetical protein VCHA53O466_40180 [Vibrio chagasii]
MTVSEVALGDLKDVLKYIPLDITADSGSSYDKEMVVDELLVKYLSKEVSSRFEHERANGMHGWWDTDVCSPDDLMKCLERALADHDMVGVMGFAAMIHARKSLAGVKY